MELLNKFLRIIDSPQPRARPYERLASLNPEKFYVETIRSLLDVPYEKAEAVIKEAVSEGIFVEGIEILCPDGAVRSFTNVDDLPETVDCMEFENGSYEPVERRTADLARQAYYRLA